MPIEPLNTNDIIQFLQQVKAAENSRQKEIRIDINTAKNLALTLGMVMSRLEGDLEKLVKESSTSSNEIVTIKMDPGAGW